MLPVGGLGFKAKASLLSCPKAFTIDMMCIGVVGKLEASISMAPMGSNTSLLIEKPGKSQKS